MDKHDLEIIEDLNCKLPKYNLQKITIDEYFLASELSSNKNPIAIMENLFLARCQIKINKGNIKDLSSDLFIYSTIMIDKSRDSAIKLRRYGNQFRSIYMLVSSDIKWTVRYFEDKDCKECSHLSKIDLDIEDEAIKPSCPFNNCSLPHNICRNIPSYISHRDHSNRIIKHNKDYSKLLKIKFIYNED